MNDDSEHSHPDYRKIYLTLLVLFVISVAGPWLAPGVKIIVLLTAFGIAIVKALLVASNFMHLKTERKYIWHLFIISIVFLFVLFAGVAPDVMNKHGNNWVKYSQPSKLQPQTSHAAHAEKPPVVETKPPVVETKPPVVETKPPVVETKPPLDPKLVAEGKALFQSKICFTCHQTDPKVPAPGGAPLKAPKFVGDFWGKEREVILDADPDQAGFQAGSTVKVTLDEAYFSESVESPFAKVVKGAIPGMAPLPTTPEERKALATYVRSLSE